MRRRGVPIAALALIAAAVCARITAGAPEAGAQENDFRFAILGDRTGEAHPGVYEQVWREIDGWHPDFVVSVGDTIEGGNDATAASEWRALRQLWERRYATYFTAGNHDIWSPRSRAIFEQQAEHPPFYGFNYQNAHFTMLDNSRDREFSFGLSGAQMQFLDRDLEQNRDREPKFVFFHKPFWLIPVKLQSSQFAFHQLIKKYGVSYVVSGHGHQFVREVDDGVTYIEAPSSGGKLKGRGFEQGWFYGWIGVTVKGAKVEISVKEIGAPFGQGRRW